MNEAWSFEAAPMRLSGPRFKTGLHCHTLHSDGGLTPQETAAKYRDRGYHCLSITDHRKVTPLDGFSADDFLFLGGTENGGHPDIIGVGVESAVPGELPLSERASLLAGQGGFTIAAHPTYCAVLPQDYAQCADLMAMEILNAYCDDAYANGLATELWDMLLGMGKRIWGVAADDAHLNPKKRRYSDAGQGWVEVWAEDLTERAVLEALRSGRFFSTQGPVFKEIAVEEKGIRVECSPAVQVRWRTYGKVGHVEHATEGGTLEASSLPEWFKPTGFVRIELVDSEGRKAWSNPFFVR